jgi:hypothetical protein
LDQVLGTANIQFFRTLSQGSRVRLFRAEPRPNELIWIHNKVERDLVWGEMVTPEGVVLPLDAYLYDLGSAVCYGTGSHLDRDHGFALKGGYVYLQDPLPSQYPVRWTSSGYSLPPSFGSAEKREVTNFVTRYMGLGFEFDAVGYAIHDYWKSATQGCFDCLLVKGPAKVGLMIRTESGGFLRRSTYFLRIDDYSHRGHDGSLPGSRIGHGGTVVVDRRGLNLPELKVALVDGIDAGVLRAR